MLFFYFRFRILVFGGPLLPVEKQLFRNKLFIFCLFYTKKKKKKITNDPLLPKQQPSSQFSLNTLTPQASGFFRPVTPQRWVFL